MTTTSGQRAELATPELATDGRTVYGRVCSYNTIDSYKTRWLPGAFEAGLRAYLPPLCLHHDKKRPIGRMTSYESKPDGLYGTFRLADPDAVPAAREAQSLLRDGMIDGLSIGFADAQGQRSARERGVVDYRSARLNEVSVVTVASVPGSRVLAMRSAADDSDADILEAIASLDRLTTGARSYGRQHPKTLADYERNRRRLVATAALVAPGRFGPKPPPIPTRPDPIGNAWDRAVMEGTRFSVPKVEPRSYPEPILDGVDIMKERPEWFAPIKPEPVKTIITRDMVDAVYASGDHKLIEQLRERMADPNVEVR